MLITHQTYTETIETSTVRVRNNVARWYMLGVPVFTIRDEVWRKGAGVSDQLRERVYATDNHECVYCGGITHLTIDHRVPQIEGGVTKFSNLLTACKSCNSSKNGRTPEDAMMPLVFGRFCHPPQITQKHQRHAMRLKNFIRTADRTMDVLVYISGVVLMIMFGYKLFNAIQASSLQLSALYAATILIFFTMVIHHHKQFRRRRTAR
jgi:hypothetical protein